MNGHLKRNEYIIENVAYLVDTVLNQASVEGMFKMLAQRIPAIFSETEDVSAKIAWLDKMYESFPCIEPGIVLVSDIVINGKNKGFIEIKITDKSIENNHNYLICDYEKRLHFLSRMFSSSFEKRMEIDDLNSLLKRMRGYCNKLEDYIFVVDPNGNILDFNTRFEICTGYTAEELCQMNINDLMPQCSDTLVEAPMFKDADIKGCSIFEFDHRCKNGDIIPMSITCKPLEGSSEKAFICVAKDVSEVKKTRLELQGYENKYSTIVEKGNDGIIIVQDGNVRFANPKIFEITGFTLEDVIDKSYLKLISPHERNKFLEYINQCDTNAADQMILHVSLMTKDNNEIPVEINGSLIDYENRKAELLIIRDISERKHNEELLEKERDRLMNYLDVAGSIIGIVGRDLNIIFVNKKGAEVLGYTKEEIIGKNWFDDFLPESVREMTKAAFIKVLDNEVDPPQYFENLILTKSGEERLIFWHDVPIEDENGKRFAVISSGEDITESRKIEARLVESEKKLKTIFDHVDDQIYIYRPYGKFIDVNRAVTSSTGYTKKEILEMSPKEMARPELRPLIDGYTERIIKERTVIYEMYNVCKDNSLLPLEFNSKLIDYNGEQAILAVARDITERKKGEEKLKRYAGELKHSNELKDLFTDIIRHDLLTPASVVKGYTEELIFAIEDKQLLKLAEKVRENNDRLIELLETATKLAKLQKEDDIDFENTDIVLILHMLVESFKTQLENKEHEINIIGEGPYYSVVNPVIEEVFANLLSNAIKYSPQKSRIEIAFSDEGDMWKISVTDIGTGISNEDKPFLFNRFHRADKKGIKGTGLGLAIVKRIIELHGGEYGVKDNPAGQGSVFWVTVRKA
ncbi:PAS domain-containing sensor histidine kinase [Methanolobus psychrotolerans]|uniref:PAS domain-containing sensor histidine kinase n=1 Tax=Methanolobus psychrotolerans TaxID=1874706 RepID=UPI0013ECFF20|nr:PAS domain S-box protein [Methanolobus psychrotolerans]